MKEDGNTVNFSDNGMGFKLATLYDEHANITSNPRKFVVKIDNTDHAAFYCEKCEREVRIVELEMIKEAKEGHKLKIVNILRFFLYCETCGGTDTKKDVYQ